MEKRKIQKIIEMLVGAVDQPKVELAQDDISEEHTPEVNEDQILTEKDLIFYEDTNPNTFEKDNHFKIENI